MTRNKVSPDPLSKEFDRIEAELGYDTYNKLYGAVLKAVAVLSLKCRFGWADTVL